MRGNDFMADKLKPQKLVRRRILFILFAALMVCGALMIPRLARPALALRLSLLFNMRVTMDNLDLDWGSGEVTVTNLRFHNQEGFVQRPHLFVAQLRFRPDWPQLLNKNIRIQKIELYRPVYVIERKLTQEDVSNNVKMWWHWIKSHRRPATAGAFSFLSHEKKWNLLIDRINIREGEFLYHQYGGGKPERKYYFRSIHGHLSGLIWPDPQPEKLDEEVFLKGLIGERHPVPVEVKGHASFATYQISFDLSGKVRNGSVIDYEHLWSGLPVNLQSGSYDLDTHVICLRRNLRSHNTLVLKDLDLKSRRSLSGTIWGMPVKTWVRFVESEKRLRLNVPLEGEISSPSLGSGEAFNEAFQEALRQKTVRGIQFFTNGAEQIASQTESLVRETPGLFVGSIEKIASIVPVPRMEMLELPGKNHGDKEKTAQPETTKESL